MSKARIGWIDTAKGILIILVVIGHMMTSGMIHDIIYSFHLFAFVFLSGVIYKKRNNWKEYIMRDCAKLYISYIFFSVIWIIFDYFWQIFIVGGGYIENILHRYFADPGTGKRKYYGGFTGRHLVFSDASHH